MGVNRDSHPPRPEKTMALSEVNVCTHRAGYTDRDGQQMVRRGASSGWSREYEEAYERAFGHS